MVVFPRRLLVGHSNNFYPLDLPPRKEEILIFVRFLSMGFSGMFHVEHWLESRAGMFHVEHEPRRSALNFFLPPGQYALFHLWSKFMA